MELYLKRIDAYDKDFVPKRDATVVTRLKDAGGCHSCENEHGRICVGYVGSAFGVVRNAYDPSRNPSGSSAGTGSGIAAIHKRGPSRCNLRLKGRPFAEPTLFRIAYAYHNRGR